MTRLFVAVDLSDELRAAVERAVSTLRTGLRRNGVDQDRSLRWVAAANLHVTLHFIGHVPDDRIGDIRAALADPLGEPSFVMELGRLGTFPAAGPPRVLWLGVAAGTDALGRVHREVGARLTRIAQPIEARPFHAHVTLARTRGRVRPLSRERDAFPDALGSCSVDHVTLYRSQLSATGSRYEPLVRCDLGGSAA